MSAYIIVEVKIHNQEEYEEYKRLTPGSVDAYGGRFVVRGGMTESLEGDWNPERIVVLEFPTIERAKEWYHSKEYTSAKKIRHQNATSKMLLVQGFEPPK